MRPFRRHHGEEEGRHRRRGIRLRQRHQERLELRRAHLRRERERRRQTVEAGEGGRADGARDASRGGGVATRPSASARPASPRGRKDGGVGDRTEHAEGRPSPAALLLLNAAPSARRDDGSATSSLSTPGASAPRRAMGRRAAAPRRGGWTRRRGSPPT